jgi:hypothetical protein
LEFPNKIFQFNRWGEVIHVYFLNEEGDGYVSKHSNFVKKADILFKKYKDNLFYPPVRSTLEKAQYDGERYIDHLLEHAEKQVKLLKNHSRKFEIIE